MSDDPYIPPRPEPPPVYRHTIPQLSQDVKFHHVMSKELAAALDEECKLIGGISRRALMNVLLHEHYHPRFVPNVEVPNLPKSDERWVINYYRNGRRYEHVTHSLEEAAAAVRFGWDQGITSHDDTYISTPSGTVVKGDALERMASL